MPFENWIPVKTLGHSKRGVVAAQSAEAAEAGAEILRAGGNAADAAVATAFALAVTEPWMSGLGGCGYFVTYDAAAGAAAAVDFGTRAPADLDTRAFPVLEAEEIDADLFGWPRVLADRNIQGPLSIGLPGSVAGLGRAHARFGRLPWKELLAPAVDLARRGHQVTWWTTLKVAGEALGLRDYPEAAAVYLPQDLPPVGPADGSLCLDLGRLADSLQRLADAGADDFYRGDLAEALAADMKAAGSWLTADDLAAYEAVDVEPRALQRGGVTYHLLPGLNAGPTFADALSRLPAESAAKVDAAGFVAQATALEAAYERRLNEMGHDGDRAGQGSTTHISVADSEGNLVSLTNTLLSLFGSKVLSPATGVLINNGVMWFDPRPGGPNAIAAGMRPLSNMCPLIATKDGRPWLALGASGGRRILPAVFQVASFLTDAGFELGQALAHPRINVDGGVAIEVNPNLADDIKTALAAQFPTVEVAALATPNHYANPMAVLIGEDGIRGATQPTLPTAAAIGA